jgi:hypothetical protein
LQTGDLNHLCPLLSATGKPEADVTGAVTMRGRYPNWRFCRKPIGIYHPLRHFLIDMWTYFLMERRHRQKRSADMELGSLMVCHYGMAMFMRSLGAAAPNTLPSAPS